MNIIRCCFKRLVCLFAFHSSDIQHDAAGSACRLLYGAGPHAVARALVRCVADAPSFLCPANNAGAPLLDSARRVQNADAFIRMCMCTESTGGLAVLRLG